MFFTNPFVKRSALNSQLTCRFGNGVITHRKNTQHVYFVNQKDRARKGMLLCRSRLNERIPHLCWKQDNQRDIAPLSRSAIRMVPLVLSTRHNRAPFGSPVNPLEWRIVFHFGTGHRLSISLMICSPIGLRPLWRRSLWVPSQCFRSTHPPSPRLPSARRPTTAFSLRS